MKSIKLCVTIFALFFLWGKISSAQQENKSIYRVTENTMEAYAFDLRVGEMSAQAASVATAMLQVAGMEQYTPMAGQFQLPVWNRIIVLPEGAEPQVRMVCDEPATVSMASLGCNLPLQKVGAPMFKNGAVGAAVKSAAGAARGHDCVSITPLGTMRGVRLARLTIAPFFYDSARGTLTIHTHIAARIVFPRSDVRRTLAQWRQNASPYFSLPLPVESYKHQYTNNLPAGEMPPCYVIVSRPEFRSALRPFVAWKRQQGFRVEEIYLNTNARDTIKQRLQDRYNHATTLNPPPTFVLLVGDLEQLQSAEARHYVEGLGGHFTDLYYAEYTGDYFPEALIGRFSVADTLQLQAVVAKTLQYEQYRLSDPSYLNAALLVAGRELGAPAPTVTNGQVNYLRNLMAQANATIDTHCFHNPASATLTDSILATFHNGVGQVNYSGHCLYSGWHSPNIGTQQIDSLPSDGHYFFIVNNCCSSNDLTSDCFGEHLLRKAGGGAIGVIGASNETLWNEDYYWSVGGKYPFSLNPSYDASALGAYDRMFHSRGEAPEAQVQTQGQMLQAGNFAVTQFGSPYDAFYWEIYHLLGDPSLMPYLGTPAPLTLSLTDTLSRGTNHILLTGTPGMRVALLQDSSLLGVCTVDSLGTGLLHLSAPITDSAVVLTATAQYFSPRVDTVRVGRPAGARLVARNITLLDNQGRATQTATAHDTLQLQLVVTNVGGATALHHWVGLRQPDSLRNGGALLVRPAADNSIYIDTLAPDAADTLLIPFVVSQAGTEPLLSLLVVDSSALGVEWQQLLRYDVAMPEMVLQTVQLSQNGNLATSVQAATLYNLHLTLANQGAANADSVLLAVAAANGSARFTSDSTHDFVAVQAGDSVQIVFPIRTGDSLSGMALRVTVTFNGRTSEQWVYFVAGKAIETFESGNFSRFPWDTNYVCPWTLDASTTHGGAYCAHSGALLPRQTSDLSMTLQVSAPDSVAFWLKVWSETSYDRLSFFIDGVMQKYWWGEVDWKQVRYPVGEGKHTLLWRFEKSDTPAVSSVAPNCAWIDDVRLPIARYADTAVGYHAMVVPLAVPQNLDATASPQVRLYPNPAQERVVFDLSALQERVLIEIFDSQGRRIDSFSANSPSLIQYSTHKLRLGIFMVVFRTSQGVSTQRLIIVK